jgi:hypothetical protein
MIKLYLSLENKTNDLGLVIQFDKRNFNTFGIEIYNLFFLSCNLFERLAKEISKKYLFSWDEIPGNDDKRIIEFLKDELKIEWVNTEDIGKIDDGKTIIISNNGKSLSLKLNDEKTKVNLKIDNGRAYEFAVKTVNGKLNIYSKDDKSNMNNWKKNEKICMHSDEELIFTPMNYKFKPMEALGNEKIEDRILFWWQDYNSVKHNLSEIHKATLCNLIYALSSTGLLLSSATYPDYSPDNPSKLFSGMFIPDGFYNSSINVTVAKE